MDEAKRKATEKAVVDLGGEWPDEYEREPCLLRSRKCCLEGEGVYKASSFKKHEVSGNGLIFYEYICTREEFDQVKKKMKNNWRNTLEKRPEQREKTMKYQYGVEYECDGVKPDLDDDVKIICYSKDINKWMLHRGYTDTVGSIKRWDGENGGYHITKFCIVDERYKPKSNWHERGELPPVGEIVEYNKKMKVRILGHHPDGDAIWHEPVEGFFPDGASYSTDSAFLFRPLHTERDELIDELDSLMNSPRQRRAIAEEIVDLGWRPPKN